MARVERRAEARPVNWLLFPIPVAVVIEQVGQGVQLIAVYLVIAASVYWLPMVAP